MALNVAVLRSSLEIVVERQPEFTPRFYEILFARFPQVQSLFGKNSRDNQAKMLQESIVAVMDHVEDAAWLTSTLGAMGAKHLSYGVEDHMYPWVGECLIATLGEIAGDAWTPEVRDAWVEAFGAISGLMLAGAQQERANVAQGGQAVL
jgi:hemoglobin-like flavoprotein